MARLLISAAHTMENPGAVYQDLREADLTRKLLALCLPHLDAKKIEYKAVPLDLPLIQRIEWINNTGFSEAQGDIFVELHINDGGKRGVEGWYRGNASNDNRSQRLAQNIVDYVCKTTGYQSQGAKSEYEHELTSLLILNSTNPSGTCVELLYLDNPEDIAILKDDGKMNDLAKVIVDAIDEFFKDDAKRPLPQPNPQDAITNNNGSILNAQVGAPLNISPAPTSGVTNTTLPSPVVSSPAQTPFAGGFGGASPIIPPASPFGGGLGSMGGFGGGMSGGIGAPKPGGLGAGSNGMLMDREQRKTMIKETYLKIMGKEISQNDLNYYLNLGSSKSELIEKLIEHADFQAIIKDGAEAKELRTKIQKLEGEVALLQSNLNDTKALQTSLAQLLEQKNIMIQRLYQELQNHRILIEGQHIDSFKPKAISGSSNSGSSSETAGRKLFKRMMKIAKV